MKRQYAVQQRGPEIKVIDLPTQQIQMGNNGSIAAIPIPLEGSAFYNRVGRRVRNVSFQMKAHMIRSFTNSVAVGNQYQRCMLVYDRQPNGAFPVVPDVLSSYDATGITATDEKTGPNPANKDRFVILKEYTWVSGDVGVNGGSGGTSGGIKADWNDMKFDWFVKLKGLETVFKASTGTVGDITTGALFLLLINSDSAPPNNTWVFEYNSRLRFLD